MRMQSYLVVSQLLRHVGVIWFVFHVLQLLPIKFAQQNLCIHKIYDEA